MFSEATVDRTTAVEKARQDLNFLGALSLGDVFKYLFPPIFLAIWQILTSACHRERGKERLAIGLPRGFGKTIFLKLYCLYLVLFSDRKFILVVCNTQQLAENFLTDVADLLDNANIKSIFGDWRAILEKDTLSQKKFRFRGRNIILAAMGAGTSLRGLNIKFVRPDIIIMDDMQSREEAESLIEANASLVWMLGTLMKAASPDRCLYIFVGNMYPFEGSILKKLKYNPEWLSFITAALLEDGESIWPELKPAEELIAELENDTSMGHPEIFYSEVMNDEEAGTRSGVDISKIRGVASVDLPEYYLQGCVIVDPSAARKKNSDDIVLGAMLVYDGVPVLRELQIGKWTPKVNCQNAIKLALKYNLPCIAIEGTAYQATLGFWMQEALNQLGIKGIEVLLIYPTQTSKVSRIISMFKQLVAGEIKLHADVRSQVVNQIKSFNPLKEKGNKDDILDICAYMQPILTKHPGQITLPLLANLLVGESQTTPQEDLELMF